MKSEMERVPRPRRQARQNYNSMSRWYDLFTGSEKRFTEIGIQKLDIQPSESILEIGCGIGYALVEFAKRTKGGKVVAIDISEKMLQAARKKLRSKRVEVFQADGLFIPFSAMQFDTVFLSFTLELFDTPEIPHVLAECHRVLKVDGRIGIVSLAKQDTLAVQIYEWFHKHMPSIVDCRPIFLQSVLNEAKFSVQQSTIETMWGLPVEIVVANKKQFHACASTYTPFSG